MSKLTDRDKERIISLYGSQMSVSDITKEINKDKPAKLQISRQAISKILNMVKSCKGENKVAQKVAKQDNKEIAREIYNNAMNVLKSRVDRATPTELLKIIEYYNIMYNFAEEGSEDKVTSISITVEDGSVNGSEN